MGKDIYIILNSIKTPDGTILISRHQHDYVEYRDKNGLEYMVDGGLTYLRRFEQEIPYTELSVYSTASYDIIRKNFYRASRGKTGKAKLKWVPLCKISDDWLNGIIEYNKSLKIKDYYSQLYKREQRYRKNFTFVVK